MKGARRARSLGASLTGMELRKIGVRRYDWNDPYSVVVSLSWPAFAALLLAGQMTLNLLFALLYVIRPGSIANAHAGSVADAFFFSLETMATVGYGELYPGNLYGHVVSAAEIVVGVAFSAIITGLIFVRFSRPKPCFGFADTPIVGMQDGEATLMLRVGNMRVEPLLDAEARISILLSETTHEGHSFRRTHELALVRARLQVFPLTWLLMHRLDAASPLHGLTHEEILARDGRMFVTLAARDPLLQAHLQEVRVFTPGCVVFDRSYTEIVEVDEAAQRITVDMRRLSETEKVARPDADGAKGGAQQAGGKQAGEPNVAEADARSAEGAAETAIAGQPPSVLA